MNADPPNAQASIDPLVERCLDGDQVAWSEVVARHRRKVFHLAFQFVGRHEEAEELTQDIFLKVFRSLASFDRRANFSTWLLSVSRNLCIDYYRRVRLERQMLDRDARTDDLNTVSGEPGPAAAADQRDRRALLRRALDELAEPLRTAVILRDLQELSYQEIARRLDVPQGTVKSRINRGRLELARHVKRLDSVPTRPRPAAGRPGGPE